jgi:hypothetical protein
MPTRSPTKKTSAAVQKRKAVHARPAKEVQAAITRSIESRQSDEDAAQQLASLLGNNSLSSSYRHTPLPSRLHHELGKLLEGPKHVESDLIRSKLGIYLELAKVKYKLPLRQTFYPRNEVPVGGKPYEEEFFKREIFHARETGLVAATGFGQLSPNTGQFQMVAVSMGTKSQIWLGPTVEIETEAPTDLLMTANVLLEHQFTLSATRNAPPSANTSGWADSEIYLRAIVTARDKTTSALLPTPDLLPWKPLNMVSLQPGLAGPGFTTVPGGRHISPGTSWQGGSSALNIAFDPGGALPPNAPCEITMTCLIVSDAAGAKGEGRYGYACVADTRAYGKFSSIECWLFT